MTELTMNLEECLEAILSCEYRTLYINPESDDIIPMLKNSLAIVGVPCRISTKRIIGKFFVIIGDDNVIRPQAAN